jgi:diaminopimelate epimerase
MLYKAHGLGNDYLVLELSAFGGALAPPAVRALCDRHRGVGSDGVLADVPSVVAEFGVRIFNPDGSEAEKSGNGLRIFAAYLYRGGRVKLGREFRVETLGGVVSMRVLSESAEGVMEVEVEMGTARFGSEAVGLRGPDRYADGEVLELEAGDTLAITPVSIGNPHCVVFEEALDVEEMRRRGPQISTHPFFENGTNVQFARVAEPGVLEALVWERGAGETEASGSSACAVAAAALHRGLVVERTLAVRMPGGVLEVEVREDWSVRLRGPVEDVFQATLSEAMRRRVMK